MKTHEILLTEKQLGIIHREFWTISQVGCGKERKDAAKEICRTLESQGFEPKIEEKK